MSLITLKGITWNHSRGYDPLVAASELYRSEHEIEVIWRKRSLKDFGDQSIQQLSTEFDLLVIDHPHVGVAAASGCLLPLETLLSAEMLGSLAHGSAGPGYLSYQYEGYQWALPVDAAFQSACYRPDLFRSSLPASWDQVFALAEWLRPKQQFLAMALCPTDALCSFLSLGAQLEAFGIEKSRDWLNRERGLKVLQLLRKLSQLVHPQSLYWNPIQLYDHMAGQEDVVYCPLAFNYTNYSRRGFRKHLLTFANPPGNRAVLGGAGIAVSAYGKNSRQAADYAAWVCSEVVQKGIYTQHQGQPGHRAAWDNEACNHITHDFFKNTLDTLLSAYVRPRFTGWPDFQEKLGEEVHGYLKNRLDEKPVLGRIQELYQETLNK